MALPKDTHSTGRRASRGAVFVQGRGGQASAHVTPRRDGDGRATGPGGLDAENRAQKRGAAADSRCNLRLGQYPAVDPILLIDGRGLARTSAPAATARSQRPPAEPSLLPRRWWGSEAWRRRSPALHKLRRTGGSLGELQAAAGVGQGSHGRALLGAHEPEGGGADANRHFDLHAGAHPPCPGPASAHLAGGGTVANGELRARMCAQVFEHLTESLEHRLQHMKHYAAYVRSPCAPREICAEA